MKVNRQTRQKPRQTTIAIALAHAIEQNCLRYFEHELSRDQWHENQLALWAEANRQGLIRDVMQLVTPSLSRAAAAKSNLIKDAYYNVDELQHVGWTEGDRSGHLGYSFGDGNYPLTV